MIFGKADGKVVELSDVAARSGTEAALANNASFVVNGKTLTLDLSAHHDGSNNNYYTAAEAIAAAINGDSDLQTLGYSAAAATLTQVNAGKYAAGDIIISRAPATTAMSLESGGSSRAATAKIDAAITTVNVQRSELGAVSNRLSHTVNNLTNISANLSAARGGIEDADFALETTQLAKLQILNQAATAMLAQANASKQNILSLLQQ